MTININAALLGLDELLALLESSPIARRMRRGRLLGTAATDVLVGDARGNVENGRRGNDVLLGKGGNDQLSGAGGNDTLVGGDGNDQLSGGNNRDTLYGGTGDDQLNGDNGNDILNGGAGNDVLDGGNGDDLLVGGDGVDNVTGGAGRDIFMFDGNVFANGTPAPAGQTGINVLGQPDIFRDYTIGEDRFGIDSLDLGIETIGFQKGQAAQIGNGNVIVLTDAFPAAGAAARAIAGNSNITADEGIFIYFNTTLGLNRVVYSKDLGAGGDISILANLDNQRGAAGQALLANFTAADFELSGGNAGGSQIDNNGDTLFGNADNNTFNGGNGDDVLEGRGGNDNLTGGGGNDIIVGGAGVDTLTGGTGRDQFLYNGDPFANGAPAPNAAVGLNILNQPDIITDFIVADDQFGLDSFDLGIDVITFQSGASGAIANGNVIVLTDAFAAAGAAARAIANNPNVTADEGVFVYFNTTLGLNRVVYSRDLGDGGDISVLANLDNQRGAAGQALIPTFTAANFALV